jgi:hypothetical protein
LTAKHQFSSSTAPADIFATTHWTVVRSGGGKHRRPGGVFMTKILQLIHRSMTTDCRLFRHNFCVMKNITRILLVVGVTGTAVSCAQKTTPTNSEPSARTAIVAAAGVSQELPAAPASNNPARPTMPDLSAEERTAVIAAANETVRKFVQMDPQSRPNDEIPERIWSAALSRLKPMRVVGGLVNVRIVLKDDNDTEEGFYVLSPASSYWPGDDNRFALFEKLSQPRDKSFGSIYHYRIRKTKNSP